MKTGLALAGLGLLAGCVTPLPTPRQAVAVRRIGYLAGAVSSSNPRYYQEFLDGLREYGWIEGQTIAVEQRWAEGMVDQLPALTAELLHLPVEIIVTIATPAARAARQATGTVPIVFIVVADPVEQGLVASLARPGGNVTGVSTLTPQLSAKRLQLLKEALPDLGRVAVLWPSANQGQALALQETEMGARALGLQLVPVPVREPADLEGAFETVTRSRAEALIELPSLPVARQGLVAEFATRSRLASMHSFREDATAGGLMSFGPNYAALYRRAAHFVDKILKGANPGDLPVEQPTVFDFVINLKSAQALGVTIPQSVLAQATEVIQ